MSDSDRKLMHSDWQKLNAKLLWCYEDYVNQGEEVTAQILKFREHRNNGAWLIRSGWARVQHENTVVTAEPGQWLIPKPCQRIQSFAADTKILSIGFQAEWPNDKRLFDSGLSAVLDGRDFPGMEETARHIVKAVNDTGNRHWSLHWKSVPFKEYTIIQARFHEWILELYDALEATDARAELPISRDGRVNRIIRILQDRSTDQPLDLETLARRVGLSVSQMNRVFKKTMGTTPAKYHNELVFTHACSLLKMPELNIQEVAGHCGFDYLSHFSLWFKKRAGISPRAFRSDG